METPKIKNKVLFLFLIISAYMYFFIKLDPEYRVEKTRSNKVSFIIKNKAKEFNGEVIGVWGGNISFRMKIYFPYSSNFDINVIVEEVKKLGFSSKYYKHKHLL